MKPSEYVAKVRTGLNRTNWVSYEPFFVALCQAYADRGEWTELERFFSTALRIGCAPATLKRVRQAYVAMMDFRAELQSPLAAAVAQANARPEIKAVYFEYCFDGGEGSSSDFFLCRSYDREDDAWASHFSMSTDVVKGPSVRKLMDYDPDFEVSYEEETVVEAFYFSHLLAAVGRPLERLSSPLTRPFGFSQHDISIVHVSPSFSLD